jgi:hypothetical protein
MDLCIPSVVYFFLSFIQIIIDCNEKKFNTALLKFIITVIFMVILNIMCNSGLTILAWVFVLIPFMFMTFIISLLLITLKLNPNAGVVVPASEKKESTTVPYVYTTA